LKLICWSGPLLAIVLSVQAQAPQTPSATPAAPPPIFRSTTNLVLLDVVVTRDGMPVHGLPRSAFHLYEDGHEQKIDTFDEHSAPFLAGKTSPAKLPTGTYTNMRQYPPAPALNIILLDWLNTPPDAQADAQAQLDHFLKTARPGVPTEVFKLDSGLHLVAGFSDNPAELADSLKLASLNPQASTLYDPEGEKRRADIIRATPPQATKNAPQLLESLKDMDAMLDAGSAHDRVTVTLAAFAKLSRILGAVPGRKNLIWISGSFPISIEPDTSLKDPFYAWQNFGGELQQTAKQLAAARVAIYPIDARGLTGLASTNVIDTYNAADGYVDPGGTPHAAGESDDMKFLSRTADEHMTMRQIARSTGGKAFVNTNAIAAAIASAEDDGANYYSVGYIPQKTKLDGNFHTLKVKIDGGSYHLAYRNGYLADTKKSADKQASVQAPPLLESMMLGAPLDRQIGIAARLIPADSPDAKGIVLDDETPGAALTDANKGSTSRNYIAALLIDPHDIVFDLSADGTRTATVQLALIAYNRDGRPVSDVERHVKLRIPAADFAPAMKDGLPVRFRVNLPIGFGFLRLALHDPMTNRIGSLEIPVSVSARS
jgi:VWFA-related protein